MFTFSYFPVLIHISWDKLQRCLDCDNGENSSTCPMAIFLPHVATSMLHDPGAHNLCEAHIMGLMCGAQNVGGSYVRGSLCGWPLCGAHMWGSYVSHI